MSNGDWEINKTLNKWRWLIDSGILILLLGVTWNTSGWKSEVESQLQTYQAGIKRNTEAVAALKMSTDRDSAALRGELRDDMRRIEEKLDRLIERSSK